MKCCVLKFGGTSVATTEHIKRVSDLISLRYKNGESIVVVVSAMAGVTNNLAKYIKEVSPNVIIDPENDVVLSSGEQTSVGLLALALKERSLTSKSYLGWQLPITTDSCYTSSKIVQISTKKIEEDLSNGIIPVVAGFQGMDKNGRLTTLGRGGSDTTAVALAAALNAERCDIYTDVDGIYTADPNICSSAVKLNKIAYSEAFEMSSNGAKVLQARSVELAMTHGVKVQVLSSFDPQRQGTMLVSEKNMEINGGISGIAHSLNQNLIKIYNKNISKVVEILSSNNITYNMLSVNTAKDLSQEISFVIDESSIGIINKKFDNFDETNDLAKISIVGTGLRSNFNVSQMLFNVIANNKIHVVSVSTSEICISILIKNLDAERAINILHKAILDSGMFNLKPEDEHKQAFCA